MVVSHPFLSINGDFSPGRAMFSRGDYLVLAAVVSAQAWLVLSGGDFSPGLPGFSSGGQPLVEPVRLSAAGFAPEFPEELASCAGAALGFQLFPSF